MQVLLPVYAHPRDGPGRAVEDPRPAVLHVVVVQKSLVRRAEGLVLPVLRRGEVLAVLVLEGRHIGDGHLRRGLCGLCWRYGLRRGRGRHAAGGGEKQGQGEAGKGKGRGQGLWTGMGHMLWLPLRADGSASPLWFVSARKVCPRMPGRKPGQGVSE